jgi:predicted ABC-type ATPase
VTEPFDARPLLVAIAGPNGAGKSTFFEARLSETNLVFVNADQIAREEGLDDLAAAVAAERIRRALVEMKESFAFETVLSDPAGEKVRFLREAIDVGYHVVLCFIGIESAAESDARVAMRTLQGGHDVPSEKLHARFPRTMRNLERALEQLPNVTVYDNSALNAPFREVLRVLDGVVVAQRRPLPNWLVVPERLIEAPR